MFVALVVAVGATAFENEFVKLTIDERGRAASLVDKATGRELLARPTLLAVAMKGGRSIPPGSCRLRGGRLVLDFPEAGVKAEVRVFVKGRYFVFEVEKVEGDVDELAFVNLRVKPSKFVSGMSGVAGDEEFAVCLRALGLKALVSVGGGPPLLRATCFKKYGLEGARALLVICPFVRLREVLKGALEAEGEPCSPLGGPWALDAPEVRGSYMFATVSEQNVDEWIRLAKLSGMTHLHLIGWWRSLGHYEPRPDLFPHGLRGLKAVVDKIHAAGLKAGMHILTGCISPNDPWVTPVPDGRLAYDASFTLAEDLDEKADFIPTVERPPKLDTIWAYASKGNVIRIGDELVQYSGISQKPPYGFTGCKRGAFGTRPACHRRGERVLHMFVRYCSFLPDENSTLVDELADAVARVFNFCGFDMIYMDGAEGMGGWHGIAVMRRAIFERLEGRVLVEASCWDHHSWPFHSRIGAWDHPRWGLKRFVDIHCEAMERLRRASLLPVQLGWWAILGPGPTWRAEFPDEIEYLCVKALAHDMPISLQGVGVERPWNARQEEFLALIGRYERLRLRGRVPESVKRRLREPGAEFHLLRGPGRRRQFVPVRYLKHKVTGLGDGSERWAVVNPYGPQPLRLRIEALYSVSPFDGEGLTLARFEEGEFTVHKDASGVEHRLEHAGTIEKVGGRVERLKARSGRGQRRGAWAMVGKVFSPPLDMGKFDAIGVWVCGDGKGEVLNFQLRNLPQYWPVYDEHYVKVDFRGWRYFELPLRERDAEEYVNYRWPYHGISAIFRSPLIRHAVSELNIYVNNVPPGEEVECLIGPVRALKTVKARLRNISLTANGERVAFPVELESGQYIEFEPPLECRLYSERGELLRRFEPKGEAPTLRHGQNWLALSCDGPEGLRARLEVTVAVWGEPFDAEK